MDWAVYPTQTPSERSASRPDTVSSMTQSDQKLHIILSDRRRKRRETGNVAEFETILQSIDDTLARIAPAADSDSGTT